MLSMALANCRDAVTFRDQKSQPFSPPFVPWQATSRAQLMRGHSASYRKPGNNTANHFPSCTAAQARRFADC